MNFKSKKKVFRTYLHLRHHCTFRTVIFYIFKFCVISAKTDQVSGMMEKIKIISFIHFKFNKKITGFSAKNNLWYFFT